MITIKNVKSLDGDVVDQTIPSSKEFLIDGQGKLLLLPGMIDPHISFGPIQDRNWDVAISSAIRGGLTSVIEIPQKVTNNVEVEDILKKSRKRFLDIKIPLRHFIYAEPNPENCDDLGKFKDLVKGVIVKVDPDQKETIDDEWGKVFLQAAWENLPIIINAFDESDKDMSLLEKAIYYAEKQNARLYVLNVSTENQIRLIKEGRKRSLLIYAETTPAHLYQPNTEHLWKAIDEGVIETVGSGFHMEHQHKDRLLYRGANFSLSDPVFIFPLLFAAHKEKRISLESIVNLTHFNIQDIFNFERTKDFVLVELDKVESVQKISDHQTSNIKLNGWPVYTIVQGKVFTSPHVGYHVESVQ